MNNEIIKIELTKDEALVLFEFLSRFMDTNELNIIDQSEERALWNLQSYFEEILVEPFDPKYIEIIDKARDRLRDRID